MNSEEKLIVLPLPRGQTYFSGYDEEFYIDSKSPRTPSQNTPLSPELTPDSFNFTPRSVSQNILSPPFPEFAQFSPTGVNVEILNNLSEPHRNLFVAQRFSSLPSPNLTSDFSPTFSSRFSPVISPPRTYAHIVRHRTVSRERRLRVRRRLFH